MRPRHVGGVQLLRTSICGSPLDHSHFLAIFGTLDSPIRAVLQHMCDIGLSVLRCRQPTSPLFGILPLGFGTTCRERAGIWLAD